jgi:hypothetical protein
MPTLKYNRLIKEINYSILHFMRSSHIRNTKLPIEILYIAVVSLYTASLSLKNYYVLSTSCVRVFHMTPAKSAGCIRKDINYWVFTSKKQHVSCEEGSKFLCIS